MKTIKIERLYPTESFGNIKYSAEGLETIKEIKEVEANFDKLAKEYKENEDKPSITLKCGNESFVYNQKNKTLFKELPKEKQIIKGEETKKTLPF